MCIGSRAARFLVVLQIALFVLSAVMMSGSVAVAREIGGGTGTLGPNHPVCIKAPCAPGGSYTRPCRYKEKCPLAGQPF
ncbi:unnamed protein product [Alopecurus aequalis]